MYVWLRTYMNIHEHTWFDTFRVLLGCYMFITIWFTWCSVPITNMETRCFCAGNTVFLCWKHCVTMLMTEKIM